MKGIENLLLRWMITNGQDFPKTPRPEDFPKMRDDILQRLPEDSVKCRPSSWDQHGGPIHVQTCELKFLDRGIEKLEGACGPKPQQSVKRVD